MQKPDQDSETTLSELHRDDACHLTELESGNHEWWYFDVIENEINLALRVCARLGTDPTSKRVVPQLFFSLQLGDYNTYYTKRYRLCDFSASPATCEVALGNAFSAVLINEDRDYTYHVSFHLDGCHADLHFAANLDPYRPIAENMSAKKRKKTAEFFWFIPLPRAFVTGSITVDGEEHQLRNGIGYHDHNYWKVGLPRKLQIYNVINDWCWGRFANDKYTAIFLCARYFGNCSLKVLMIAENNAIIHNSVNEAIFTTIESKTEGMDASVYPSSLFIESAGNGYPIKMSVRSVKIIDKTDLLEYTPPFLKRVIEICRAKPRYIGLLADGSLSMNGTNEHGRCIYEYQRIS